MTLDRNTKGLIGFSVLAFILGIIVLPFMIGREVYQSTKGGFDLEWDDIIRYGIFICIFSMFHWVVFDLSGAPVWMFF